MRSFSFENLVVWQKSKDLAKDIYGATKFFPKEELYGLTSQLRRAAVSISSNLAEGTSRETSGDKARFSTIAYSSLMETLNHLIIAKELNYISESDYLILRKQIEEIGRMLNALKKQQKGQQK